MIIIVSSTAEDNISLTHNGMRLSSVTGTVDGKSISATFSYDECGRTTYDGVSSLNYVYDQIGALASVSDASTSVTLTTYRHLSDGTKYATVSPSGGALLYRGPFTLKIADISASTPSVSFLRAETGSAGATIIANASGTAIGTSGLRILDFGDRVGPFCFAGLVSLSLSRRS